MKKLYLTIILGWLCIFASLSQPADLVLSSAESGTKLHQATNSITFAAGYSCTPSGGTMTAEIVEAPISGNIVYSQAINPDSYSINTSLSLKSNPINISVSGVSVCSVPIEVPNGAKGLQPNLSLNYIGNFTPYIFGTGWNIGGLSVIGRVNPNIYNDNQSDPIEGNLSDRYALDGNRLTVVNGTYGTAGSEYRTEREEFSRIVAYGTAGQGPQYFIVYTQPGLIYEYGNSTDSRVLLDGSNVLYWKVNKISDRYGNYMTFKYVSTGNEQPIEKIEYTGNTSQSTAPFASINFHYKYRSNISTYTIGEVKFYRDILLTDINITNNGQFFKKYEMDYCENNGYPLLQKITEYSSQNQPFNPQAFTYTTQTEQFSPVTNPYSASVKERIYQGDFNGDGRMDILTVPLLSDESLNKKWKVYVANQNGTFSNFWEGTIIGDINDFIVADFNGDGLSDFAQIDFDSSSSDVYYFPSTGTGFGNPLHTYWSFGDIYPNVYIVDYNGDGRLEVMGYKNGQNANYELRSYSGDFIHNGTISGTGTIPPFGVGSSHFQIQDFNGDGCSDLLTLDSSGFKLHEFKGVDNKLTVTSTGDHLKNTYSLRYGDFNGDGTTDVLKTLGPDNPGWKLVVYTRYGFKETAITGLPNFNLNFANNQWNCCDLNGDGKMDVILWGKGTTGTPNKVYSAINKVNGYQYSLQEYTSSVNFDISGITPDNPLYFYFGDYNGDMRDEFFYSKPGSQRYFTFASGTPSNLMKVTIDGLGTKTSLTYLPSSSSSVYTAGPGPDYPLANYTRAIQLVSTLSRDNGTGGTTPIIYKYEGAKVHLQGKGFLGFSKTTETNNATGIIRVKTVDINGTYYYSQLSTVITGYGSSNILSSTENEWHELDFGNKRFFPYIASSTETDELTKLSRYTSQDYFADGNLKSVARNFSDGPTRKTEYLYNDERIADWLIGRPTTITETSTGGGNTRTFVTNRSYFSTNDSPDVDQYNTGDASAWTLDREYDAFGNLWKEHRSATGLSTRTTAYTYESNGLNLLSVTDPVGRIDSYTYVPATNLVSTQTDPFGNLTTYNYNSADQLSSVTTDGGITTTFTSSLNATGGPTNARYYIQETGSDGSQVKMWYDKLKREIRKETKSFYSGSSMITVDQLYNEKGQVYTLSEPSGTIPSRWNSIVYDNYGRITSQDPYYGATTTFSYADSITTRTVNGRNYTSTINSAGLVTNRTDPGGSIRYAYYPDGLLKSTLTSDGVSTVMTYNRNGNRLSIADPSAGTITDTWYGTGEIKTHQNARGQNTIYTYQTDGLLDKYTTSAEGETDFTYNTNGQVTGITSPGGVSRGYTYDTRGRVGTITESIDGVSNTETFNYDTSGRLYRKYFNGSTDYEQYEYKTSGYLYRISFNGTPVWELMEMDEYGRYEYASIGVSPTIPYFWEYENNNTLSLIDGLGTFEYSFNVNTGNLNSRTDGLDNSESFGYDAFGLDRLTSVTGPSAMSVNYGSNGNILTKSDAGTGDYAYANTPYAVSSIPGTQNISTTPQDIDYYSFEKVKKITEGTKTADFVYNADQQRIRMILKDNGVASKTRWYFGGSHEREQVAGTTTQYIWIGGDAYSAVAVARKVGSGSWEVFNIFRDHSGTMTSLRNSTTDMIDDYSFDAWGRRRDKDNWTYNLSGEPALFAGRGFTAHEHLEDFNLINMNGRLYDPVVGRFLSPDPFIQAPDFSQNFNRYSYALNNPLKYTDPSGYTWWSSFWNWVGEGFDNLGDWMNQNNVQFQVGVNMSGSGTVPFANVAGPNGANISAGYNMENNMLGIGTNTGGFNSFWYPSYNYNAPIENAYASIESGMNEWYAKNGGGDLFMGGGWHPPMALYNIDKAVNWLNNNAHESWRDAKGQCAYYVRMALEAGGINTSNHPVPARLYGSYLESWGFSIENPTIYLKGDITVIQGYPGATSDPRTGIPYGHIQMYNGSIWISDFKQSRPFWPSGKYEYYKPTYTIYRWGN